MNMTDGQLNQVPKETKAVTLPFMLEKITIKLEEMKNKLMKT